MSKNTKTTPTLCGLATEFFDNITSYLSNDDLTALHNVNSTIYEKTKYAYATRFFTNVHVFMSPVSFEKLTIIANDSCYAKAVKHITLSTYVLRDRSVRPFGTSTQIWDEEKRFIYFGAKDAVTNVFNKCHNLATLVISDYDDGCTWNQISLGVGRVPIWGINKLNRLVQFKRGMVVVTEADEGYYSFGWQMRAKAFEAILMGMVNANGVGPIRMGLAFEGKGPRPLVPEAQPFLSPLLVHAEHFTANLDSFTNSNDNIEWLSEVNPKSMKIDYDMKFWEAPGKFYDLHLGTYTELNCISITTAKTTSKNLIDFLKANSATLRDISFKHISLDWPGDGEHPWIPVFKQLKEMEDLESIWPTDLVGLDNSPLPKVVNVCAHQEVPWEGQQVIALAIGLVLERFAFPPEEVGCWVDLEWVQEVMELRYGIAY